MEPTPVSLLFRLRRRDDDAAWQRFVTLYTPLLFFWACRLGLKADEAGDLVQDVFVTLVQKLPSFEYDSGKRFRGFLRTIIENRWRDRQRRKALQAADRTAIEEVPAPPADDFSDEEYRRVVLARATEIMKRDFEPNTWKAFWALTVEQRPGHEIAAETGMSLDAVYAAKARVLRRLRGELEGLLD